MIRLRPLAALLTALVFTPNSWACSCIWQGPFSTVFASTDLVVAGRVVASKGNAIDLEIEQILRGREFLPAIRIWMQTGQLCRPPVADFPLQDRFVMALKRIEADVPGGFNPNTPNISHGRIGDYSLSKCGAYWLFLHDDRVSGNISGGPRWEMNPKMSPVLLELLAKFIDGEITLETLKEAGKPSAVPRELMLDTKSFLRQQ